MALEMVGQGFSAATLTTVLFTVVSVYYWRVLAAPLIDLTLSLRRWYYVGLALAIAAIIPIFFMRLIPEHSDFITILFGVFQFGTLLAAGAAMGFMSRGVSADKVGKAAGWYLAGIQIGQGIAALIPFDFQKSVSWQFIAIGELALMLTAISGVFLSRVDLLAVKPPIQVTIASAVTDGKACFRSSRGIFISLMALSPIGVGAAYVGWPQGIAQYGVTEDRIRLIIGPIGTLATIAGLIAGGWASDKFGRWKTWLWSAALLAGMALLLALCPQITSLFVAGMLVYTFVAASCTAAFWAIIVAAVGPRLSITKITLLTMLMGVAVYYMRYFDGLMCDDLSFRFMLIGEALLSLACIGIVLLFRPFRKVIISPLG